MAAAGEGDAIPQMELCNVVASLGLQAYLWETITELKNQLIVSNYKIECLEAQLEEMGKDA